MSWSLHGKSPTDDKRCVWHGSLIEMLWLFMIWWMPIFLRSFDVMCVSSCLSVWVSYPFEFGDILICENSGRCGTKNASEPLSTTILHGKPTKDIFGRCPCVLGEEALVAWHKLPAQFRCYLVITHISAHLTIQVLDGAYFYSSSLLWHGFVVKNRHVSLGRHSLLTITVKKKYHEECDSL